MASELVCAYRAMEPAAIVIATAREMGGGRISEQVQEHFLNQCINDDICRKFPPSPSYVKNVIKKFILATEEDSECVLDDLYSSFDCCQSGVEVSRVYKTYTYTNPGNKDDGSVTLQLSNNILEGGTGCYCWPAGLYLAEVLLSYPWMVASKRCLELGAGAGLLGVCLSRLEPSKVILTDGDHTTLNNLDHNLGLNGLKNTDPVQIKELLWESSSKRDLEQLEADVILAADVIYDPVCIPSLLSVLWNLLTGTTAKNVVAFLATVKRNPRTLALFVDGARSAGLDVVDVTETMKPSRCWRGVCLPERDTIVLHKVTTQNLTLT